MKKERRYDLDWLRVLVFALLIFYHVGMFFVPWDWHIKNNETSGTLRWPMVFINQWRIPILFVISGMGTAFALSYRGIGQFIRERNARLGIPLLFGMLLIVPPQVYIERISTGVFEGSYLDFLLGPAYQGIYPEGNFSWHHLWFLPYLLVYSIILSPLFLYLRGHPEIRLFKKWKDRLIKHPVSIYIFVIPLFLCESLMEPLFPVTHNLIWDWFNFTISLVLFFYGFFFISIKEEFWQAVGRIRNLALMLGILCFSGQVIIWLFFEDSIAIHFTEATLKVVNLWSWILVIFGFASQYLNKFSNLLSYCNQAVYPFYILHQTVTIMIGYYLMDLSWPISVKFILLLVGTFFFSWVLYEFLIRRLRILRPFFGVKHRIKS